MRGLRAGAAGFLSKDMELASLPRALRGSLDGEAAISRRLAMQLIQHYRSAPTGGMGLRPVRSNADRPRVGGPGPAVGRRLHRRHRPRCSCSRHETVRSHLKNLYRKLEVRSREEAVEAAARLRELGSLALPVQAQATPASCASSAIWTRLPSSSLASSRETCALTVATLM